MKITKRQVRQPAQNESNFCEDLIRNDTVLGTKQVDPALNIEETAREAAKLDEEICSQMNDIRTLALDLAKSFPRIPTEEKVDTLSQLLKPENTQLVRYMGCLALGGKGFTYGWHTLVADDTCREALVLGIIGRALKEHVFSELYFGADDKLAEKMEKMEREQVHLDGRFT